MGRGPTWREKSELLNLGRKSHLTSDDMIDIEREYNQFLSICLKNNIGKKPKKKKVKENKELKKQNKAQVLENAQPRVEISELKKQNLNWEKEYNKLEYDSTMEVNRLNKQLTGMAKHIDELEHQAADIKYLNQDEVEDILNNMMDKQVTESGGYFKDGAFIKAIDKLCSLAIKPTTKEKK